MRALKSGGERGIRTGESTSEARKHAERTGKVRTECEPKAKIRKKPVAKRAEDFSGNKQAGPAKVAQGSERNGKTPTAERDGRNEPSGAMSSSAQIGTQTPERNETGCLRAAEALTMREIMQAVKEGMGKLPIMTADTFFLRGEYAASVLGKPRKWEHVSTAAILRLGAGRALDCIKELRRLENLFEEIRKRFEKVRSRFAGGAGATGTPVVSLPAPRTPAGQEKQMNKANGRAASAKGGMR